jgi:hypothetical protein
VIAEERLPERSLLHTIQADLALISVFSEEGINARIRLQSTVVIFSGSAWAASLSLVLERQVNDERAFVPSVLQVFRGLRSQVEQPLLCFCFPHKDVAERYLLAVNISDVFLATTGLLNYVLTGTTLPNLSLPIERIKWMSTLKLLRDGDLQGAQGLYRNSIFQPDIYYPIGELMFAR